MSKRKNLTYLTLSLITLAVLFNLCNSIINTYRSNHRLARLKKEVEQSEEKITALKKQLEEQESDDFIEEQARNKLNLIKPGEKTVILGEKDERDPATSVATTTTCETNWEKWKYLFFRL